ncbi:MAG: hypothetical protein IIA68_13015 [Proteobacteria bacterium]|nr:hypothetical protein [Pseudomonadota bacterium]
MNRYHLDIAFVFKALGESGAVEGYAGVFDVVDGAVGPAQRLTAVILR